MRNKRRTDEEWLSFNRAERKAKSYAIGRKNKNEWSSQTIRFYFRDYEEKSVNNNLL